MELTAAMLDAINGITTKKAETFCLALDAAMARYHIDTPARVCCFLAQVLEESGHLVYVKELASGAAYEGRTDLGNTQPGDGIRYKGRGLIQITGKANYILCSQALFRSKWTLLSKPERLEEPQWAAMSAAWYWNQKSLNMLADKIDVSQNIGTGDNLFHFKQIVRVVNGGFTHLDRRLQNYQEVRAALYPVPAA